MMTVDALSQIDVADADGLALLTLLWVARFGVFNT
jgi:hypothetical protein